MVRATLLLNITGKIIVIVGLAMLTSVFWAIYYNENNLWNLVFSSFFTISVGLILIYIFRNNYQINYREGFAVVTFGWVAAIAFGSLPFILSGHFPTFADALFESVSGFTTTGASVLVDVEVLPYSLLFWRSLTQWLGGMGIMALFIAIIAGMGARGGQIFRAEIPGGETMSDKISPRIRQTARILWFTYIILSSILLFLLYAFGMNIFDAFCHTFSTMSTGGFSTKNASVGFFNPLIQWTIILFMIIGGTNFTLHYLAFKNKSIMAYLKNKEFKLYSFIIVICTIIVFIGLNQVYSIEENLRTSLFQVVSILTTTGYATADYEQWACMDKGVLLILMFLGGCAGSTSGNIKIGRYLIMLKRSKTEFRKMIHPKAMINTQYSGKSISESLVVNVLQYFFLHIIIIFLGTIILTAVDLDLITALSATASCMGNIGPGFGLVGPTQNYAFISDTGKYVLSLLMFLGRLEIYPVLILFFPEYWKK